jgi:hypothetical protein
VAEGVLIPSGEYRFDRVQLQAESSSSRPWSVGSTVVSGAFFTGRLTQLESFLRWTLGPGRLQLELQSENDFGYLPEGDFIHRLWQLKTIYAFSPNLVLSAYTQYDSESRDLGLNSRLRWTVRPGRDLFVVWNKDWQRQISPRDRFQEEADQVVVKLRWTTHW